MMIRTAGGPGLVSPIDFSERRKPLPAWMWAAIGASVLVHAGAGIWLYQQRFALPPGLEYEEPAATIVTLAPPIVKPEPKPAPVAPPAPTPPIHRTETLIPSSVDPLVVPVAPVTAPSPGPVINLTDPAPVPASGTAVRAEPTPPAPPVITQPDWVRKPTADQMMRAYPSRALATGTTGTASLSCLVRVDGSLSGCAVTSETPGNQGFGRAAMGLSRYFRLSPRTVDGQAVDGARVNVTIRFNLD